MNETMPTSEVLNRAADLIEERGWATGSKAMLAKPGVPLCLESAIAVASGARILQMSQGPTYSYADAQDGPAGTALRLYLGKGGRRIWDWNDAPGRTASEVVEVLRACAVVEASRERETAEVSS